ncbi:MAG TPA: hypothetical protein VMU82_14890 [Acetobacteraceae bacterium]|nr:hypothetical protein [Acetobacteraceae bacterium]
MRRFLMILLLAVLVVAGAGFVWMGLFPPSVQQQQVQTVLPNSQFSKN